MKSSLYMVLLVSTLGCQKDRAPYADRSQDTDSGDTGTDLSDRLGSIELSSFRTLRKSTLSRAEAPTDLVLDTIHGPALILDTRAARVWGTDALFLHDPRTVCIDNENVRNSTAPQRNGACPPGTEKTARGSIETTHPPIAISMTDRGGRAGILDQHAQLHWVTTDPIATTAKDFMRPVPGPVLPLAEDAIDTAIEAQATAQRWLMRARICLELKNYDDAESALRHAERLGLSPDDAAPRWAELAFNRGDFQDVAPALQRMSKRAANNPVMRPVMEYWL